MSQLQTNYIKILDTLKAKIQKARIKATVAANTELLRLYWEIGNTILEQQKVEGWGTKVTRRLAKDLKIEFPDMKGLSERNLVYMQTFASSYPNFLFPQGSLAEITNDTNNTITQGSPAELQNIENQKNIFMQGALAQLSWYHHTTLLDKVKDKETRLFYIQETVQNGWSRDIMVHQIESGLHNRKGKIISNFKNTIAPEKSELVQQLFKDPYKFEFIYLARESKERDLENALTVQLTKFLLELGQYFSFMGRQYKMMLGEKEYYFDLLFYHTRLKRYIIIDLKIDDFKPEYKGKMEFYLNLADEHLKQSDDEKTIGLILCKTKDGLVAEYALRDSTKPIGIAEYKISELLPENIRGELPSIEELEIEIDKEYEELKSPVEKKIDHLKNLISKLGNNEAPQKRTEKYLQLILQEVVILLKNRIKQKLKDITKLFDTTEIYIRLNNREFKKESEAFDELIKIGMTYNISLEFRLNGFNKVGAKAFFCVEYINFRFDEYGYRCFLQQHSQEILWESMYQKRPTEEELIKTEDEFIIKIATQVEDNINRLNLI